MAHQSPQDWLEEYFEYEYCAECGGDAPDHDAIELSFADGYFAHCRGRVPQCEGDDGQCNSPARYLAAQSSDQGETVTWRRVCKEHVELWNDQGDWDAPVYQLKLERVRDPNLLGEPDCTP